MIYPRIRVVCCLSIVLQFAALTFAQDRQGPRIIDVGITHKNPDYVTVDSKVQGIASRIAEPKNLESFAIRYKAWSLIGEFVYNAFFAYENDKRALVGGSRTVDFWRIQKYPDLVKRYKAIRPSSVNFVIRVHVWTTDSVNAHMVYFKVTDNDLLVGNSRQRIGFNSPTSPIGGWKKAASLDNSDASRFTASDTTDEAQLKKIFQTYYNYNFHTEWPSLVSLDLKWPDDAIDQIAADYERYEKEGKKAADELKDKKAAPTEEKKIDPNAEGEMSQPAEEPVKIELQNDFDNTTVKQGVIRLSGTIKKPARITSGQIVAEGYTQSFEINDRGLFSSSVVLKAGANRIRIKVGGKTLNQNVHLDREPVDLRATLTWNSSGSDVDLYVVDPDDFSCYYQNKSVGNMRLDVDNTSGFGPENIYVTKAKSGSYTIRVQNYRGGIGAEATVYVFVNEVLKEFKKVTFSRSKETIHIGNYSF